HVAGEQLVPLTRPDDLDDVPPGAAEDPLQLLDDLPVAAHRSIETLQVAVHNEGEVVELLASRERERPEGLGLIALAVAEEAPHPALTRVGDVAVVEVAVEARLVDGVERPEAHGNRRELPELRHQARVRIRVR